MALDSTFVIDAKAKPSDARATLLATGRFSPLENHGTRLRVGAQGLAISIFAPPTGDADTAQAGITATLEFFIVNTDKEIVEAWEENTIHAVIALLHAYPGDALLMYCSDTPVLLRKDGRLILDKRTDLWEVVGNDLLALVDLPYEFGIIPVR